MDVLRPGASLEEIDEELELVEVMINSLDSDDEDYDAKKSPLQIKFDALLAMRDNHTTAAPDPILSPSHTLGHSPLAHRPRNLPSIVPASDSEDDLPSIQVLQTLKRAASPEDVNETSGRTKSRRIDDGPSDTTADRKTSSQRRSRSVMPDRIAMHMLREEELRRERADFELARRLQAESDAAVASSSFSASQQPVSREVPGVLSQSFLGRDGIIERPRPPAPSVPLPTLARPEIHNSPPPAIALDGSTNSMAFSISQAYPDLVTTDKIRSATALNAEHRKRWAGLVHHYRDTIRHKPIDSVEHRHAVSKLREITKWYQGRQQAARLSSSRAISTDRGQAPDQATILPKNEPTASSQAIAGTYGPYRSPLSADPAVVLKDDNDDDIKVLSRDQFRANIATASPARKLPALGSISQPTYTLNNNILNPLQPFPYNTHSSQIPQYHVPAVGNVYRQQPVTIAGPSQSVSYMDMLNGAVRRVRDAVPSWMDSIRIPGDMGDYHDDYRDDYRDEIHARGWDAILHDPRQTEEDLKKLLENIRPDEDLPAEMRVDTPEAMKITLMKHQVLGLTWLKNQEEGSNKGAILADDMGLGKTIQALALIVTRPSENRAVKTTLIVAPVALLKQWANEIADRLKTRHALTVYTYHGQKKKASYATLANYDVVLTTYGTLATEWRKKSDHELKKKANPDHVMHPKDKLILLDENSKWYRIILDEAQYIKNRSTQSSQGAAYLSATYRLCMTGTPMMNNVGEFYSLIRFLRIPPYNNLERFNRDFYRPLHSNAGASEGSKERAMQQLQVLMKSLLLRRTKKSMIDGKPILNLPERTTEIQHSVFDEAEADFYKASTLR